jgi:hypothetical protein
MGRQGLTRRGLAAGLVAAVVPSSAGSAEGAAWAGLVRDLQRAQEHRAAVMAALNEAERRYFALPKRQRRRGGPDWFSAAQEAEAKAAAAVDALCLRIAQTRAASREGLAVKIRLLAAAYGDDPDAESDDDRSDDLVSHLIRSLLVDLGPGRFGR